jgi:hypothetical protein
MARGRAARGRRSAAPYGRKPTGRGTAAGWLPLTRRPVAGAVTLPEAAAAHLTGASSAPGILSPRKITVKGAPTGASLRADP